MTLEFNVSQCSQLIFFCNRIQLHALFFMHASSVISACLARTDILVQHCFVLLT